MSPPLVSIVTPAYNHEKFIGPCIESVLNQSFDNWEMLIVDDGSKDKTLEKARFYSDPRIRIFPENNKGIAGLGETYNVGLRNARGSVIAILEGDDYWPPNKLAIQTPDFLDKSVVLSWGRAMLVTSSGVPYVLGPGLLPPWDARLNIPTGRAAFYMMSYQWQTFTFASTVLLQREALERIGGFIHPPYADYIDMPTFMRISLEGGWRFHPEVLGYWRRHLSSTTYNSYPRIINAAHRWAAEFTEKYGDLIPARRDDRDEVDKQWNFVQKDRLLATGRMAASEGRLESAVSYFEQALTLRIGKRTRKMLSFAIFLAKMGRSPELAFKLGKQPDWRLQVISESKDPLISADIPANEFVRYDLMKTLPPGGDWQPTMD